jgi:hypothetical protein
MQGGELLSDYFPQSRAVDVIDSGSEHGRGDVYASDGISRHIPRIRGHWAPAYTFGRLFFVDLVPAVGSASYDASLSHPILEAMAWWANYMIF